LPERCARRHESGNHVGAAAAGDHVAGHRGVRDKDDRDGGCADEADGRERALQRAILTPRLSDNTDLVDPLDPCEATMSARHKTYRIPVARRNGFAADMGREQRTLGLTTIERPPMSSDRDDLDRRRALERRA